MKTPQKGLCRGLHRVGLGLEQEHGLGARQREVVAEAGPGIEIAASQRERARAGTEQRLW